MVGFRAVGGCIDRFERRKEGERGERGRMDD